LLSPLFLTFSGKLYSEILAALSLTVVLCCVIHLWSRKEAWPFRSLTDSLWYILLIVGLVLFSVTKSAFFPLLGIYLIAFLLLRRRLLFSAALISLLIVIPFQARAQQAGRGPLAFSVQVAKVNWSYTEIAASALYNFSETLGSIMLPSYNGMYTIDPPKQQNSPNFDRNPYVMGAAIWQQGFSYGDGLRVVAKDPIKYVAIVVATVPAAIAVEGIYPSISEKLVYPARLLLWLVLKLSLSLLLWFGALRLVLRERRNHLIWVCVLPGMTFFLVYSNFALEQRYFFPLLPLLWLLALSELLLTIGTRRRESQDETVGT
jgi:hypothetical protein